MEMKLSIAVILASDDALSSKVSKDSDNLERKVSHVVGIKAES